MNQTVSGADDTARGTKRQGLMRRRSGVVVSDKADKTIVVSCDYLFRHAKYGKVLKRRTRLHAHDETNEAKVGDRVEVAACRRMSKTKAWRLVRVLVRGRQFATGSATAAT